MIKIRYDQNLSKTSKETIDLTIVLSHFIADLNDWVKVILVHHNINPIEN